MVVSTARFGALDVSPESTLTFPHGILGFPLSKTYVLVQPQADSAFYWLQSVDDPELAFVVVDPRVFVPDYQVPVREETQLALGLADPTQVRVLVIVNKVGDALTANLQGPLVLNPAGRRGLQLVVGEKRYATRHPIVQLPRAGGKRQVRQSA